MYFIASGAVEVQIGAAPVRLGSGDFFGEIALVSDRPRTATVTMTSPGRVLVLTDRAFRDLMKTMPSIQPKVMAALADRLPADEF